MLAHNAMVASSQPLATQAGIDTLRKGGNAIDAAIAVAAVLDVVEPFSTGCGGDAFVLMHIPGRSRPLAFNGSGRSGSLATLEDLLAKGWTEMPLRGGPSVSVPGAMHLWHTLSKEYGNLEFGEVLEPAINYAKEGFPVSPVIAQQWISVVSVLRNNDARRIFTIDGRAPAMGSRMRNVELAQVFEEVASEGVEIFYKGWIAEAIVDTVQRDRGFLTLDDLASHSTERTEAISTGYHGVDVYEHIPNGQGFAALIMLNIMEQFQMSDYGPLSPERYHLMIEAKKIAYDDLYRHNADPSHYDIPLETLLSKDYATSRSALIQHDSVLDTTKFDTSYTSDTVYLCTADSDGMAVSFINSLYRGFGSGLVAEGTGIKLQNRANLFSLNPKHPNCYAPKKRPFHTIIPGALYQDGQFLAVFGIMVGAHQAQAHAQFVSNIVDFQMGPQQALDHPRFNHDQFANTVSIENGVPPDVQGMLQRLGHRLIHETMSGFGGGQSIFHRSDYYIAGSDYRKDGQACGF